VLGEAEERVVLESIAQLHKDGRKADEQDVRAAVAAEMNSNGSARNRERITGEARKRPRTTIKE
jgi:hypothetical protein